MGYETEICRRYYDQVWLYLTDVTKTEIAGAENEHKERGSEKWEQNRNRKLKMIGLGFKLGFFPIFLFSSSPCSFLAASLCFGNILINLMLDYFPFCRIWP